MNFTLIALGIVALYLMNSVKILAEYERGVIFRLGRLLPRPKGPGIILVFRPIDRIVRIPLRVETLEVPSQDVVTRDNVTVKVSAVVFFRVLDPARAVVEVKHYVHATSQLAQTRLRSVLGEAELDELLSGRETLNTRLQSTLDEQTGTWGIKVQAVEVKHVDLPEQMIRAIARQAEAERERRAKIIHADGERQAAQKLTDAAETLSAQPGLDHAPLPANADRDRRREKHHCRAAAADRPFQGAFELGESPKWRECLKQSRDLL